MNPFSKCLSKKLWIVNQLKNVIHYGSKKILNARQTVIELALVKLCYVFVWAACHWAKLISEHAAEQLQFMKKLNVHSKQIFRVRYISCTFVCCLNNFTYCLYCTSDIFVLIKSYLLKIKYHFYTMGIVMFWEYNVISFCYIMTNAENNVCC